MNGLSEEAIASQLNFYGDPRALYGKLAAEGSPICSECGELCPSDQHNCKQLPKDNVQHRANTRMARSTGPVTELPPASNAMPLFAEKLKAFAYGNENLVQRKEKLHGGFFAQSAIYTDPAYVPRHNYSDEEWRDLCELYDLDPEDTGFWETDKKSWSLGGGRWAPQEPLPTLIATYVLMEGEIEALLEALYPGTPTEEVVEKIRKRIEGKKGKDGQDGLKVLVRQLARLVRGGNVGKGAHPPDISPHEFNVACRSTELREEGWSDEDIYQRLCESEGFAQVLSSSQRLSPLENFQRLADLELRYPFS